MEGTAPRFFFPSRCDLWWGELRGVREGLCWFLLMRKTGGMLLVCVCSPSHLRRCERCRACLWWGEREVRFVFVLQKGTENLSQAPRMRTHGEDGDILNEFKMLSFSYPTSFVSCSTPSGVSQPKTEQCVCVACR